ncbi:MAG TPA: hypothetical protein VHI93_08855 [Candidatus Thermoplasmatota archaeon]|nr:hypothetical protein [Candidatus Thermoplasmatota archaeon]
MLSPADILRTIASRHVSLPELEAELAGEPAGFLRALDACVEEGLVAVTWHPKAGLDEDRYRLTRRGQRMLRLHAGP